MRWVHALGAAVAATTLVGSTAKAVLSVSLLPVNVPSSIASTIGAGQTVRTFDLQVTQTATEKFQVANLQVTLASGNGLSGYFYASPNHDNVKAIDPNITGNTNTLDPYDTYVSTPAFKASPTGSTLGTDLSVTGSADWPVSPGSTTAVVPSNATNNTSHNQTMNIVWGDQQAQTASNTSGASTYTIAQFTVVGNTGAFIRGYFGENINNNPQYFTNNGTGPLAASPQGTMYLPIRGDVNLDGIVDQLDLNALSADFANAGTYSQGDLNVDGIVDQLDLNDLSASFVNGIGSPPSSGVALGSLVPEPGTLGLLAAGIVGFATRRRRA
jgi:hypothetical protein